MTCIAAVQCNGFSVIASDSYIGYENHVDILADSKVKYWPQHDLAIGFAGTWSWAVRLQDHLNPPLRSSRMSDRAYVSGPLYRAVLSAIDDHTPEASKAWEKRHEHDEGLFPIEALIISRGNLYVVDSNWSVCRPGRGYAAVGCGAHYAVGSLHRSFQRKTADPVKALKLAIQAAVEWSDGVRPPIRIRAFGPWAPNQLDGAA